MKRTALYAPVLAAGLVAPALLTAAAHAAPTTYYVSTTGSDTNNCTSTATACATIQHAEDISAAGDTIKVLAGTYSGSTVAAVLWHPVTLTGAGQSSTIIDGTNDDVQANPYTGPGGSGLFQFAVLQIQNTTGAAGYYRVADMTVEGAYATTTEENSNGSSPTDVAVYNDPQADTVQVAYDTLGAVVDNTDTYGIGFYDGPTGNASVRIAHDTFTGNFQGTLIEGVAGPVQALNDTYTNSLSGDQTDYPAEGLTVLGDQANVNTQVTATANHFTYAGYGLAVDGGYSGGNCSTSGCTGEATVSFARNVFSMGASNGAAIALHANSGGMLNGTVQNNSGSVVAPAGAITVKADSGGASDVALSNNRIVIKPGSGTAPAHRGLIRVR